VIVRVIFALTMWLVVATAAQAVAQPRPVTEWSDWASYGTASANPSAAAVAAWRSASRGCLFARLALSEGVVNGLTLVAKHTYDSPRPCLGCAPDGMPSGHTANSVIGSAEAWGGAWWHWFVAAGMAAATGWLRHDAYRHTWRQIAAGALLGTGAEAIGQLIRCPAEPEGY
jgi:hypothetical protein